MRKTMDVLLCYRGRFKQYVTRLLEELRRRGVRVTHDSEILADRGGFDADVEVDWLALGTSPQEDTTWRAPLRSAVASAEMVVFALDFEDMSENVANEIRWAIQSKASLFFLLHGGTTDPEAQGIITGSLAAWYMLTSGHSEYPELGSHFCGDLDGAELEEDVVVAANRILAHLARCREGELPRLTGDNQTKSSDIEESDVSRARRHLGRLQESAAPGSTAVEVRPGVPPFEAATAYLREREMRAARGALAPSLTDRQIARFRRAEEILQRVRPGPHELSPYIGALILQAASIEEIIHDDLPKKRPAPDFRPTVVVGTILFSTLAEGWTVVTGDGYRLIIVDGNFIDLMYQVIKVSVSSAKATVFTERGRGRVKLDFGMVPEQIRSKPDLADGFYRCIRRYATEGRPGSSTLGPPGREIQMALGAYVEMAERFIVGLGYGLITITSDESTLPDLGFAVDPGKATAQERRDLLDFIALDYCVRSRSFLDRGDPLDAVAGCLFALCTIYIKQRIWVVLQKASARRPRDDPASFRERLERICRYSYRRMIEAGAPEDFASKGMDHAWATGTTPLRLWEHVEPRLQADNEQGLGAMPSWGATTGDLG